MLEILNKLLVDSRNRVSKEFGGENVITRYEIGHNTQDDELMLWVLTNEKWFSFYINDEDVKDKILIDHVISHIKVELEKQSNDTADYKGEASEK